MLQPPSSWAGSSAGNEIANLNSVSSVESRWGIEPVLCVSGGRSRRFPVPCSIQHIQPPQPWDDEGLADASAANPFVVFATALLPPHRVRGVIDVATPILIVVVVG